MFRLISVLIGTATKSFRFRSETKDGAAVYFDATAGVSYSNASKIVLRMSVPEGENSGKAKFRHIGQARIPFVRVTNGITTFLTANVDISVVTPVDLTDAELLLVSDHLKALSSDDLLARAVRERTEAGWEAAAGGSSAVH